MFDPYHKWLGIPPGKRPPTLYQLLAISEGEKDRDVIDAATVRQSAYVRNFQKGANADQATKLLAEISDAREILTDPDRRKAYDEKLAAERPKPAPAAVRSAAPAPAVVVRAAPVRAQPAAKLAAPRSGGRRTKNTALVPLLLAIGGVAVASGVGIWFATRGSGQTSVASNDAGKMTDPKGNPPTATPPNGDGMAQASQPKPFDWNQVKVEGPHPPNNPGFGRPPNFPQPPNFGGPNGIGPGMNRGIPTPPNFNPPAIPPIVGKQPGEKNQGGDGVVPPPRRESGTERRKHAAEGIDGALEVLQKGGFFDIDAASKELALIKVDPERQAEVAKALNQVLQREKHLPDAFFDAVGAWANDETIPIIADKLAERPFVNAGVIRAAGRTKNPKLVHPLCVLLEDFFAWKEATAALQQMGPAAETRVRTLLNHRDPAMRRQVCMILATIGTEKSLPGLRKAAADKQTAVAAKAAITEISERVKEKKSADSEEADDKK